VLHILTSLHILAAIVSLLLAIKLNPIFWIAFFFEAMAAVLTVGICELVNRVYFLSHNSGRMVILLEEISKKLNRSTTK